MSKKSNKGNKKCPKGEIKKDSYVRKGYYRKPYTRSDGIRVKGSYISRTKVPSTCVPDKGKKGKTSKKDKVLPKPGKKLSLSRFGYSTDKSTKVRQEALTKASKHPKYNPLEVLRRLNLIRNYQSEEDNKKIMSKDVEFMSKYYKKYNQRGGSYGKKTSKRKSRKTYKRKSRKISRKPSMRRSRKISRKSRKPSKRRSRKYKVKN